LPNRTNTLCAIPNLISYCARRITYLSIFVKIRIIRIASDTCFFISTPILIYCWAGSTFKIGCIPIITISITSALSVWCNIFSPRSSIIRKITFYSTYIITCIPYNLISLFNTWASSIIFCNSIFILCAINYTFEIIWIPICYIIIIWCTTSTICIIIG
jgi:hypothetical protein